MEIDAAADDGSPGGAVFLYDDELVMWDSAEWIEDPEVTLVVANAIVIGFTDGTRRDPVATGGVPQCRHHSATHSAEPANVLHTT